MQRPIGFPIAPQPFGGASRRVETGAAFDWLRQGGLFFMARPLLWLAGTVLTLLIIVAGWLIPLFGTALIFLLLPQVLAGLLFVCRELAQGRNPGFNTLLAGFHAKSGGLPLLGLGLALLFYCGTGCGHVLVGHAPGLAPALLSGLITLLLSMPFWLAAAFAPALIFFHEMPPIEATQASVQASLKNWPALLVFAALALLFALITLISAGIALLVLIPVMSGALYAAYRDIFPET